eukprot:Tbor_TRINITY_DN3656_c0_g1::TRINITY_DN3656_c0_g1_i1::g.238::m.238
MSYNLTSSDANDAIQPEDFAKRVLKEKALRSQAQEIEAKEGIEGVKQILLQKTQATKKLEQEIANVKKKTDRCRREMLQSKEDLSKLIIKTKQVEIRGKELQMHNSSYPARRERSVNDLQKRLEEVKGNVLREAANLSEKMDIKEAENDKMDLTNSELREKFQTLKATFEEQYKGYEDSFKTREAQTTALIEDIKGLINTNNRLREEALLGAKELDSLVSVIKSYKTQVEMYGSRFGDLDGTTMNADDIKEVTAKQNEMILREIDNTEKDKASDIQEKINSDNELKNTRQRIAVLKKKLAAAEKAKSAAEVRCRAAQKEKK